MGVSISDLLQRGDYEPGQLETSLKRSDSFKRRDSLKRRESFKRRISWLGVEMMDGKAVIDLSMKELRATPMFVYKRATSVQILKLNGNYIQSLPYDLLGLTELEELYLHSNHLQFLPAQVCALSHLTVLNVSCNNLRTLPYGVCHLSSLEMLDVSFNEICTLPESLMHLLHMTALNVEGNQLEEFPHVLTKIASLQELNVGRNEIPTLPDDMSELTNLQEFKANDNRIYSVSETVCIFLCNVKTLDLTGNLRELNICPPPPLKQQRHRRVRSLNIIPFTRRLSKRFKRKVKDDNDVKHNNNVAATSPECDRAISFTAAQAQFEQCEEDSVYVFKSFAFGEHRRSIPSDTSDEHLNVPDTKPEVYLPTGLRSPTRVPVRSRLIRQFTVDTR